MTNLERIHDAANQIPTAIAAPVICTDNHRPGLMSKQQSRYKLPSTKLQSKTNIDDNQIVVLQDQGFPKGLAKALSSTKEDFPLRIWVVDNSGSMQKNDGQSIVKTKSSQTVRIVPSTRWNELQGCIDYHTQMAALLQAPTSFRLLNDPGSSVGPQQFGIAEMEDQQWCIQQELQTAQTTMRRARPSGVTPLTEHILEIQTSVREMLPELRHTGKRVAIILATDGLPTSPEGYGGEYESTRFISALRSLQGLPVWVVIRLCTDEDNVVDFYNSLDEQLEISVEVLDDFVSEGKEVYKHNRWLNYGLPLHRCRELGFHDRVFDMIDERALTTGELRDFCVFLFGVENFDGMPDPVVDWKGFRKELERLQNNECQQWNPIRKKVTPWIDMKTLDRIYGDHSGCFFFGIF